MSILFHLCRYCSGKEGIPACRCRLLLTKGATCVKIGLTRVLGAGVGAKWGYG
jgi:hypothetical protein